MADGNDNPASEEDVVIARIVKARGIRGEVACRMETGFPERFLSLERVTVRMPGGLHRSLAVEDSWFHKGRVILKFEGYNTMTEAERLVGGQLVISESDALPLDEGEYYEYHIIGSEVILAEGERLGRVARLLRTGGTDLLIVEDGEGREYMIPFADDICPEVEVENRRITVNPPEGLLDL